VAGGLDVGRVPQTMLIAGEVDVVRCVDCHAPQLIVQLGAVLKVMPGGIADWGLLGDLLIVSAPACHRPYTTQENCHTRYTLHHELPRRRGRPRCSRAGWTLGDPGGHSKGRAGIYGPRCRPPCPRSPRT